ncbi:caspase family protein [candidate division KSB1 bacterium]|nr:caspase family protein [candidate division KSB1 bacterium]
MKKALNIGINNYPGSANDLQGCVNDADDWAKRLQVLGFETEILVDKKATIATVKNKMKNLITSATAGDVVVVSYSGHGTNVYDTSGDEPDYYDEALYLYDGVLLDDDISDIIRQAQSDVSIVVILDSCFSGTATRLAKLNTHIPRFIKTADIPPTATKRRDFLSEDDMVEILISGCSDNEYSYDAYLNNRYNGAFTYYALSVMQDDQTYDSFFTALRKVLPSDEFPQTPQLEGSSQNKSRQLFAPEMPSGVDPAPDEPDGPVEPDKQPWWKKLGQWIKKNWIVITISVIAVILYFFVCGKTGN